MTGETRAPPGMDVDDSTDSTIDTPIYTHS